MPEIIERQLLREWLRSVEWDHTGNFGQTIAVVCPECRGETDRVSNLDHMGSGRVDLDTMRHEKTCLVFRTKQVLR